MFQHEDAKGLQLLKLYGSKIEKLIETASNERQKGTPQPYFQGAKEMINSGIEPLTLRCTSILGGY
jgi:hypothetical protein